MTCDTRNTRGGREKVYKNFRLKSLNVDGKILLVGLRERRFEILHWLVLAHERVRGSTPTNMKKKFYVFKGAKALIFY